MKKIIITIIILGIISATGYYFRGTFFTSSQSVLSSSTATKEAIAEIPTYQYTETYTSPTYKFSFKYPKEFTTSAVSDGNGGDVVLVQNTAKDIGVQILITPFDGDDTDVTEALIRKDIPDMKISDGQEVLVGANRKGLAFVSDNEAFGGKSREVWFIFNGHLYQISTYAELDGFLKGLFATWQFTKM